MASREQNARVELCVSNRKEWRDWLKENHAIEKEIWLVYYKKHTGKASVGYSDSVEEALCYGWIDGLKRRIDEEKYAHRFTPRRAKSKWTALNVKRARSMINEGKMTQAGIESFNQRLDYDDEFLEEKARKELSLPRETEKALKANENAWDNFSKLAPGYKKQYVAWLVTAKRPETRARRLEEAIQLLMQDKKLGMK